MREPPAPFAQPFPAFDRLLPGVINDPHVADICLKSARSLLGKNYVETDRQPSLGAEDFADYPVPKCMMLLGIKSPRKKITPLHTSTFNLDEKALLVGVRLFTQILREWPMQTS